MVSQTRRKTQRGTKSRAAEEPVAAMLDIQWMPKVTARGGVLKVVPARQESAETISSLSCFWQASMTRAMPSFRVRVAQLMSGL